MKILLLNPPHPSIGSRIPREHLPPLGLLSLGGPLLDAGHEVELLDVDLDPKPLDAIVSEVRRRNPQAVLIGHSGSTSAHPTVVRITRALRRALPQLTIVYGGVFPTYHWREVLLQEPQIDMVVRGEGEATIVRLIEALETGIPLPQVRGIAFRVHSGIGDVRPYATGPAPVIGNLDGCRVAWELIDHSRYTYWGDRRAVVVQFSRGCPHRCSYCGQRGFWTRWRHRDPVRFARELAGLHREHGVEVINFADENPTASRTAWKGFLEALIAERVDLILVGSTRAGDIVRDADILHLYRRAGVARFLLGVESTDSQTLEKLRKDSNRALDLEAIRLLRRHNILSMAAFVPGFQDASDRHYWQTLRHIVASDPDQIQLLYPTPHRWTRYYRESERQRVIQTDLGRWDYKHQVLGTPRVPPWRTLLWMKCIEAVAQLRPRSLARLWFHPDPGFRAAMRWYYRIGRQVWPYELWHFLFRDRPKADGPSLAEFLGPAQDHEADALSHIDRPVAQAPAAPEVFKRIAPAAFLPACLPTS